MMINSTIKLPKPLPYQQEILDWINDDDVKYVNFLKSRQIGGTFLNKLIVSQWALSKNKQKIMYCTPTLKLAKLIFKELSKSLAKFIINENKTDLVIEFVTGSYVQFFSGETGNAIRGFQGHLTIIDECAFIKDEILNTIIKPTWLVIGKKIIMCSTPNGNHGFFYENCQLALNEAKGYKIKSVNIFDNPFIDKDEIENIKKAIPERVWQQEYMGIFLDGSGTVFTNIKNCILDIKHNKNLVHYAAIDWAKQNDYTVVTIMNELKQVVDIYRINTIEYTHQIKLIIPFLNKYNPKITYSEENNIGAVVNELLKKEYKGNLKCINLDNTLKKDIIENLMVGFETEDVLIPNNDILIRELQAFSCSYNPSTQTIKYSAPHGLHDDMVISLAYVYHLVKNVSKLSHAIPKRR